MKKPVIAILTTLSLFAALCVDGRATLVGKSLSTARISGPDHNWRLEASAPAKTWESPSLHQNTRSKATPATIVRAHRGLRASATTFIDAANVTPQDSNPLPRQVSPRAPPARSISL